MKLRELIESCIYEFVEELHITCNDSYITINVENSDECLKYLSNDILNSELVCIGAYDRNELYVKVDY